MAGVLLCVLVLSLEAWLMAGALPLSPPDSRHPPVAATDAGNTTAGEDPIYQANRGKAMLLPRGIQCSAHTGRKWSGLTTTQLY